MTDDEYKKFFSEKANNFHSLALCLETCHFLIVFNKYDYNFPPSDEELVHLRKEYSDYFDVHLWKKLMDTGVRDLKKHEIVAQAARNLEQFYKNINLDDHVSFTKMMCLAKSWRLFHY